MELASVPVMDHYCETLDEVFAEIQRRRALPDAQDVFTS